MIFLNLFQIRTWFIQLFDLITKILKMKQYHISKHKKEGVDSNNTKRYPPNSPQGINKKELMKSWPILKSKSTEIRVVFSEVFNLILLKVSFNLIGMGCSRVEFRMLLVITLMNKLAPELKANTKTAFVPLRQRRLVSSICRSSMLLSMESFYLKIS